MPERDDRNRVEAESPWGSPDGRAALIDFWTVYDVHYDRVVAETLRLVVDHPELGPLMRNQPPDAAARQAESRERLRSAIFGEWQPYEDNLRGQGAVYARMGISFGGWSDVFRAFGRTLVPILVETYVGTPSRLARAIVAMQDFTDRAMCVIAEAYLETKEASLRESEQRLATTLDSIGDAVIATDALGCVTRMNPVAERLTGWPLADARGRPLAEVFRIVHEDTGEPVESPVDRVLREGVIVGLANHTALVARDGIHRPIADSGAPIRGPAGETSGVVLVFRDMTEDRNAEEARARTAVLEAENIQVQRANRLKSEFLANMSHELRTPLNAIIGFAELLHDGVVGAHEPEYTEFLGNILTSARHLLQLINDVLDLSKVEAGKLEFHPEEGDLNALIGELLSVLGATAAERGIRIDAEVDAPLERVTVDPSRLKQVLYNYLSNALKFTGDGGSIRVSARVEDDERFRIEVADDGIGIAPEDLPKLFVEFQQLDSGTAKKHAGTGLGLALTRRLVEAQGGTVGVRSTPGKGSVFHASLPRRGVGTPVRGPQAFAGHRDAPRILVVEDAERDQRSLIRILTAAGYAVDTANTGAQALALCAERRYDAITLDLFLPDFSGLEVLRHIRASTHNAAAPVIVVTVVAERDVVAGFRVHDILPKPIEAAPLLASLERAGIFPGSPGAVLVVDDDPGALLLMSATLARIGYRSICATNGAAGLRVAREALPIAVVLDLRMPEMDGFRFLEEFRKLEPMVPVIVWTATELDPSVRARLQASAQAVIAKAGNSNTVLAEDLVRLLPAKPGTEVL